MLIRDIITEEKVTIHAITRSLLTDATDEIAGTDFNYNLFGLKISNSWWTRSTGGKYKAPNNIILNFTEDELRELDVELTEEDIWNKLWQHIKSKPGSKPIGKVSDDHRSQGLEAVIYKGVVYMQGFNIMYASKSILKNTKIRKVN